MKWHPLGVCVYWVQPGGSLCLVKRTNMNTNDLTIVCFASKVTILWEQRYRKFHHSPVISLAYFGFLTNCTAFEWAFIHTNVCTFVCVCVSKKMTLYILISGNDLLLIQNRSTGSTLVKLDSLAPEGDSTAAESQCLGLWKVLCLVSEGLR